MKAPLTLTLALGMLAFGSLSTTMACAKKKAPEVAAEPGSMFTVELGKVELLRRGTTTIREKDQLRYTLRLNNGIEGGAVAVDQVDFTYGIGERQLGTDSLKPGSSVASGAMEKVTLIGHFDWVETSDMPAGDAWVKGSVNWTGPNAARSTAFDFSKEYSLGE